MSKSLADLKAAVLASEESREIYNSLKLEFHIHEALVKARKSVNVTPEEIVEGTQLTREDVARLEGALLDETPVLFFDHLQQYIRFLNMDFSVTISKKE